MSRIDAKRRYNRVLSATDASTPDGKPACLERTVRLSLVAHGDVEIDAYRRAFEAARDNADLIAGSDHVCRPVDRGDVTAAIEYVVEHADDPREFVRNANRWISEA